MIFRIFFQVPYPLTPFVSHSSKNCRGVPTFFPFWNGESEKNSIPTPLCALLDFRVDKHNCQHSDPFQARTTTNSLRSNAAVLSQLSAVCCRPPASATPLECAVPGFRAVTPLDCAVPKTPSGNSFRMRSYEKRWGGEGTARFSCCLRA